MTIARWVPAIGPILLVLCGLLGGPAVAATQGAARPVRAADDARVLSIYVVGAQRFSESQLISALGQRVDEPLDPAAINAGLKRLWTNFRVRGDVSLEEVDGGVVLFLEVEELPSDREPRFVGNDKVDDDDLRRWALLEEQQELPIHQAERVRQRLLEGYAREGFYFAEVNIVKRGAEQEAGAEGRPVLPDVIFEIREGPKVRVKGV